MNELLLRKLEVLLFNRTRSEMAWWDVDLNVIKF